MLNRKQRRLGRPTVCTPKLITHICELIRRGVKPRPAALLCGVSSTSYHAWSTRAAQGTQPFAELVERIARAEAEAQAHLEQIVVNAAGSDWRAALALLERRWPAEYGRRERIVHAGTDTAPVAVKHILTWVDPGKDE
jgi:hypothetical protein